VIISNRNILEKLIVVQLLKTSPKLYGTQRYITLFASQPVGPILSNTNPDHILTLFKMTFNIMITSTSWSPRCLYTSDIPTKNLYKFLISHGFYMSRPSRSP
jgi:hypothetical protein